MNCPNCGAPMELIQRRHYFVCPYCTTFHFPEEDARGTDGVAVVGAATGLNCPVCEHALVEGLIEGQPVQYCANCRGLLATNGDFREITLKRRAQRTASAEPVEAINPTELEREVGCPICARRMETHPYYGPGNVVIDSCSHCFVVWLDHGELGLIERAPGK